MSDDRRSSHERRFLTAIGIVLGLRQLVLLMPLPFIAVFGRELTGSTPALIGLSLGIYALLQAVLQVPVGRWSDVHGRKRIVVIGTVVLIAGLLLAAVAKTITVFMIARALQGCGAITSVLYAWIADETPPERRNHAMGIATLAQGIATMLSFVGGPVLYSTVGLRQMFVACAILTTLCCIYVVAATNEPALTASKPDAAPGLLRNADLRRLFIAGFFLNYMLMAMIFMLPLVIDSTIGARSLWKILIPATVFAILVMRMVTRRADRGRFNVIAAVACASFVPAGLALLGERPLPIAAGICLCLAGYLTLFALLPAAVTQLVGRAARGAATGVLYTALFFGSFVGSAATGVLWGLSATLAVYAMFVAAGCAVLAVLRVSNAATRAPAADPDALSQNETAA